MKEIERKFLLRDGYEIDKLLYTKKSNIKDIYLNKNMRIRNKDNDSVWVITIKSSGDIERDEYEMPILVEPKFENIPPLEKIRLEIPYLHQKFEINIFKHIYFKGRPLILIEIELPSKDASLNLPEWVGEEVTYDSRFYGCELANFLKFQEFSVVK